MSLRATFSVGLFVLGGVLGACADDGKPSVSHPIDGGAGTAGTGGAGGLPDGGEEDATADAPSDAPLPDGGLAAVRLGVIPTPRSADGGVSPADQQLAFIDTLSAGSREVSLVRRWDDLYTTLSTPDAQHWSELEAVGTLYHNAGRSVLVCLALVDRTLDARPNGLGSWNDAAAHAALDALVDKTFATFGSELYALSFGTEIDRWLAKANATERADMLALLEHGVKYARENPARPPGALVTVTLTADSVVTSTPSEVKTLTALSDAVVVTYYPLEATFDAKPATGVANDLDALEQAIALAPVEAGTPKPLVIQELGYPSSSQVKSSEEQQRAFYEGFAQALLTRREHFPFIGVRGLHDATATACAADAKALGAATNPKALAAECSLGLKTADGTAKAAWPTVLEALATFASP